MPDNANNQISELFSKAKGHFSGKEFEKVASIAREIEELSKKTPSIQGHYETLVLNAMVLEAKNLLNLAVQKYLLSFQVAQQIDNNQFIAEALNNIGRCYGKMENYAISIEYFKQALAVSPENVKALNNLGVSYMRQNINDEALKYFLKAYPICLKDGLIRQTGINLENIAALYMRTDRLDKAEKYLQKAEEIAAQIHDRELHCSILSHQGNLHLLNNDFEQAKIHLDEALKLAIEFSNKDIEISCLEYYMDLYMKTQKFEMAYEYQNNLIKQKENKHKQRLESKVSELHSQFEIGLKEQNEKKKLLENEKLEAEKRLEQLQKDYSDILEIGNLGIFSDKMRKIIEIADKLHCDRSITTLIEGETGTGKEVIARIIHYGKDKDSAPFISINCSAIAPALFESELFGYEKGAFSGARKTGQIGKIELAQNGTLFFDEIGDLPLKLQAKLLRVIQHKEIYRINGHKPIVLNIRFIFATNRKLNKEVEKGKFRLDLFHRLNSGYIYIPPLRERIEEIEPLTQMFLTQFGKQKNRKFQYIDPEAINILENYHWQGNVRELKNTIERIVLLHDELCLSPSHLNFLSQVTDDVKDIISGKLTINLDNELTSLDAILDDIIYKTWQHFNRNVTHTADFLKISRGKIYRKIQNLN